MPTNNQSNEGLCCDAVIRILEEREGGQRRLISADAPSTPGLEAVCEIAGRTFAIEHTTVDPYPDRRADDQRFLAVLGDLESSLEGIGVLRGDCYYTFTVETHAFQSAARKDFSVIRSRVQEWILARIRQLDPPSRSRGDVVHGTVIGVSGDIRLSAFKAGAIAAGRFRIQRAAPENLEDLRRARMREAVAKKGPKLHAAHANGATSVLVLEDFDVAISDHISIAAALFPELDATKFVVDEVYLVDTHLAPEWWVMQLSRGASRWPTHEENPPLWSFAPESLTHLK